MDFRMYDGALGRFMGIDLLADMFAEHSPYHFAYNDPVSFADPSGLQSGSGIRQIDYEDLGGGLWGVFISYFDGDNTSTTMFFATVSDKAPNEPQVMKEFATNIGPDGGGGPTTSSGGGGGGLPKDKKSDDEWEKVARDLFDDLSEYGGYIELIGIFAVPATEGSSLSVAAFGQIVSGIGTVGNVALDIYNGDNASARKRAYIYVISAGLGSAIGKLDSQVDQFILNASVSMHGGAF